MIIALANRKGGVGKSTIASVIWSACPKSLIVDLDSQANVTVACGVTDEPKYDISDLLAGKCSVTDSGVIQNLPSGDIITSSIRLAEFDNVEPTKLRNILKPLREKYQHIILDSPPALNMLTFSALVAADFVVIPSQADKMSFVGIEQLSNMITAVKGNLNPDLKIAGLLLTRFIGRAKVYQQMKLYAQQVAETMGTRLFEHTIRQSSVVAEAQVLGEDVFVYAPKTPVVQDLLGFVEELKEVCQPTA